MAIRKILRMGQKVLLQRAKAVENPLDPEISALIRDMQDSLAEADGLGLAAPQIGESLRVLLFYAPESKVSAESPENKENSTEKRSLTVLINPEIDYLTEEIQLGWEACLSVPGLTGLVPRCTHIRYRGTTPTGERVEREATGFHARVFQHEYDHLDGVLYPQRMSDIKSLIFTSELADWTEIEENSNP